MEEVSHKRQHIVLFHLHEISRIGTSIETERLVDAWIEWIEGKWGVLLMGMDFLLA